MKADTYKSASIDINPFELYGGEIIFDVVREGKRVGTHMLSAFKVFLMIYLSPVNLT